MDERLLTVPAVAVGTAFDHTVEMSALAIESIEKSLPLIDKYDEAAAEEIKELENRIDKYEDKLGTFMVKLSKEEISDVDTNQVTKMLHTINDFERIGDHACNMVKVAKEMRDKNIVFSTDAQRELNVLTGAVSEVLDLACRAFREDFDGETVKKWLKVFCRRFFTQQFKRSCMPDGVKVGSISLSPRGDLRMPSDASARLWLEEIDKL